MRLEKEILGDYFGKNLKKIRLSRNLTQEELGELALLTRETIRSLEKGRNIPNLFTIYKLAYALKVEVGLLAILFIPKEDLIV